MSEWISVDDKLPEHAKPVLLLIAGSDNMCVGYLSPDDEFRDDRWDHSFQPFYISHWQPLPGLPK